MSRELFLGVSIGGSGSSAVLTDDSGKILAKSSGTGSSSLMIYNAEKSIYDLIYPLVRKRKITRACFGISGIDTKTIQDTVYSFITNGKIGKLLGCPIEVTNDVEIVLPSVAGNEYGVAAIGGTGANFYAVNNSKKAYASGLNYLLSDQGSAFDIGLKVLRAAIKSWDGRGEKTILEKLVMKQEGIKDMRELVDIIYNQTFDKSKISEFAELAEKGMKKKDNVSEEILDYVTAEYIVGIKAVAKKVNLHGEFNVAFVGSVFRLNSILQNIKAGVKKDYPDAKFYFIDDPAIGAARLAMTGIKIRSRV
jgi:N-acetylglucosamine kinase-like BadF-type ATPase